MEFTCNIQGNTHIIHLRRHTCYVPYIKICIHKYICIYIYTKMLKDSSSIVNNMPFPRWGTEVCEWKNRPYSQWDGVLFLPLEVVCTCASGHNSVGPTSEHWAVQDMQEIKFRPREICCFKTKYSRCKLVLNIAAKAKFSPSPRNRRI
jgi:hypothetical protein